MGHKIVKEILNKFDAFSAEQQALIRAVLVGVYGQKEDIDRLIGARQRTADGEVDGLTAFTEGRHSGQRTLTRRLKEEAGENDGVDSLEMLFARYFALVKLSYIAELDRQLNDLTYVVQERRTELSVAREEARLSYQRELEKILRLFPQIDAREFVDLLESEAKEQIAIDDGLREIMREAGEALRAQPEGKPTTPSRRE